MTCLCDRMRWSWASIRTITWFVGYSFPFHSIFDKINVFDHWLSLFFCVSAWCVHTLQETQRCAYSTLKNDNNNSKHLYEPTLCIVQATTRIWRRKKNVPMRAIESVFGAARWILSGCGWFLLNNKYNRRHKNKMKWMMRHTHTHSLTHRVERTELEFARCDTNRKGVQAATAVCHSHTATHQMKSKRNKVKQNPTRFTVCARLPQSLPWLSWLPWTYQAPSTDKLDKRHHNRTQEELDSNLNQLEFNNTLDVTEQNRTWVHLIWSERANGHQTALSGCRRRVCARSFHCSPMMVTSEPFERVSRLVLMESTLESMSKTCQKSPQPTRSAVTSACWCWCCGCGNCYVIVDIYHSIGFQCELLQSTTHTYTFVRKRKQGHAMPSTPLECVEQERVEVAQKRQYSGQCHYLHHFVVVVVAVFH